MQLHRLIETQSRIVGYRVSDDLFSGPARVSGTQRVLEFLPEDSEMVRLVRELDWSTTALGPVSGWSASLRMMVRFLLANRFPILLWWGPQYIQIYNDAYRPILGTKHPQFLGKPVMECWTEIWDVLKPLVDTPFRGGPSTWIEDLELEINRHGFIEESHFTVAYSPVPDESAPRGIGGVLATVHEITEKVIGERRVLILSELGSRVAEAKTGEQACAVAAQILSQYPKDVPFALLYLLSTDGSSVRCVSTTAGALGPVGPDTISLEQQEAPDFPDGAPCSIDVLIAEALRTETTRVSELTASTGIRTPVDPGHPVPQKLVVVPIKSLVAHRPAGALVIGVSPRIRLDKLYSSFLELVGSQVATAIANARAYEDERRRAEALAEIDRVKTAFFSNVSHEFRTPLTLMLGPVQDALANPAIQAPARTRLEVVHRNALRLMKLVNSLLDFARIEAGRAQARFEPVDLGALTIDLASTFRSAIERAGLELQVDCPTLREPVYVDRDMWEKIVLNLLSNAFKYTLAGRVLVKLRHEERSAVLEVADTGVGVPEADLPRLFERFYRAESTRGRTHEGTGIGLALVHELVKLHGGSIEASSEVGRGTTFKITIPFGSGHLPMQQVREDVTRDRLSANPSFYLQEALGWLPERSGHIVAHTTALGEAAAVVHDKRFASTFGARVVLADDNRDMRSYVSELLNPSYEVEAVADGEAALVAARLRRPDLVLSDVMMPKLDGFGLLAALRTDPSLRDVPVILLSARAGEESRIEGLSAGADDYIVKPFAARELLARVGALLELTRARRENELRLREADRQKNEFLAMLAHELRNPLAPIRNAGELLLRIVAGDARASSAVAIIERQVTHLARLVDDLLDISRITQGRIELRRQQVFVADVVSRALETVDPLLQLKRHRVSQVYSRGKLTVHGDPERLIQCIANVLTNAAKYTDTDGDIRIETRAEDEHAVITISDDGVGITAELLPRVFDPFVQADRSLDRALGGLGIGLSIVKRLVEMHGGSVTASSDGIGKGSAFQIRLPLSSSGATDAGAPAARSDLHRRILVVDDNEDAANSLAMVLQLHGHETLTAYSGIQALESVADFKPEFVLLDIGLPGLDGYEVAHRLRAISELQGTKVIAVTGYGQDADKERARAAGFVGHLVKPVDFAVLREVLAEP